MLGKRSYFGGITLTDSENTLDRVLMRHNSDSGSDSCANIKLKRWMHDYGWDRNHGAHEMRAFHGSVVATETGSLIAAMNQLRHKQYSTTQKHFVDLVDPITHTVGLPKSV